MLGAICGDILGSGFEFEKKKYEEPDKIKIMSDKDEVTDDTAMTAAVADWLLNDIEDEKDDDELKVALAGRFVEYAFDKFDNHRLGFGFRFWQWLCKARLIKEYVPYNSFGNGSGMRVSPVGWYFDTLEETLEFAKLTADVTHNHPEGEKGAMCIAAAIFMARNGKSKSEIKEYLYSEFGYKQLKKSVSELRASCEWSAACQDTVPMAVVAFLESEDYISTIKLSISYGSDSDTICAMSGAIAEAYYKCIPEEILMHCKKILPEAVLELCEKFKKKTRV